MSDSYEILGRQIVNELVGADTGGFDLSSLVSAASELSQKGISAYESKQKSDKDKANQKTLTNKAIAADAAWANAEQLLDIANQSHDATRVAAASALQSGASADAMNAGYGLNSESTANRVAAAQKAAKDAASDSLANPSDSAKAALSRAWQKVAARASVAPDSGGAYGGHGGLAKGGGSFLTSKHAGIPVWGWALGGTATLAGVFLLIRALRRK